jgi:hypothetical protein
MSQIRIGGQRELNLLAIDPNKVLEFNCLEALSRNKWKLVVFKPSLDMNYFQAMMNYSFALVLRSSFPDLFVDLVVIGTETSAKADINVNAQVAPNVVEIPSNSSLWLKSELNRLQSDIFRDFQIATSKILNCLESHYIDPMDIVIHYKAVVEIIKSVSGD